MICPIKRTTIRSDSEGDGHLFAPRHFRLHKGVDIVAVPGEPVYAPVNGTVTRKIYVYANDLRWTGLEIRNTFLCTQLYYVEPLEELIDKQVMEGQLIGHMQDISKRYTPLMTPHLHWQIDVIDPLYLLSLLGNRRDEL